MDLLYPKARVKKALLALTLVSATVFQASLCCWAQDDNLIAAKQASAAKPATGVKSSGAKPNGTKPKVVMPQAGSSQNKPQVQKPATTPQTTPETTKASVEPAEPKIKARSTESLRIESLNKPRLYTNIPYNAAGQTLDVCLPAMTNTSQLPLASPGKAAPGKTTGKIAPPPAKVNSQAKAKHKRPGIIFIHGGGFVGGNKQQMAPYCKLFAQAGFVSATIDYRVAPDAPYPAAITDVKDAVEWFKGQSARYGFDQTRVVLVGESAGGNLAMMAGFGVPLEVTRKEPTRKLETSKAAADKAPDKTKQEKMAREQKNGAKSGFKKSVEKVKVAKKAKTDNKSAAYETLPDDLKFIDEVFAREAKQEDGKLKADAKENAQVKPKGAPLVAGIVSISAPSDLAPLLAPQSSPVLAKQVGSYLDGEAAKNASPVYNIPVKAPPVLLIHGEDDDFVPLSQSGKMLESLHAAKVPAILRSYPKVGHQLLSPNPQLGRILREMTEFLIYIERRPVKEKK